MPASYQKLERGMHRFSLGDLRRNQACWPFDLRPPTSKTGRQDISVISAFSWWYFVLATLAEWDTYILLLKKHILRPNYLETRWIIRVTKMYIVYFERIPRKNHWESATGREKYNLGWRPYAKAAILVRMKPGGFLWEASARLG